MLLELFFGGTGLSCQAGLQVIVCLSRGFLRPFSLSPLPAGGSSPLYIGSGLGFRVTGKLQVYPYDITTVRSRLGLVHHCVVGVTPDREYCSSVAVVWGWSTCTDRSVGRSGCSKPVDRRRLQAGSPSPPWMGRLEPLSDFDLFGVSGVHLPNSIVVAATSLSSAIAHVSPSRAHSAANPAISSCSSPLPHAKFITACMCLHI